MAWVWICVPSPGPDTTVVAQTTSDADGNYAITIETNGVALDGYFKGTFPDYMETYLYPPWPVAMDFAGATIALLSPTIFDLLANTLCGANQPAGKAAITAMRSTELDLLASRISRIRASRNATASLSSACSPSRRCSSPRS